MSDEPGADEQLRVGGLPSSQTEPSRPVKRSFSIAGHRTSISLEHAFWVALREIARDQDRPLAALVAEIDRERGDAGLSSAVRVWVLDHYRRSHGE